MMIIVTVGSLFSWLLFCLFSDRGDARVVDDAVTVLEALLRQERGRASVVVEKVFSFVVVVVKSSVAILWISSRSVRRRRNTPSSSSSASPDPRPPASGRHHHQNVCGRTLRILPSLLDFLSPAKVPRLLVRNRDDDGTI